MTRIVKFTIDGRECLSEKGQYILYAARDNGVYIPTLCNLDGVKPRGACRVCNVKVNGRWMTACTTPVSEGMKIENDTVEIQEFRKMIIEILFVEGNHLCPSCEKSGSCELQALGYRFRMAVPRFPYQFPNRDVEGSSPKLIKDHNRCILCKRCIRAIKDQNGKNVFAFHSRSNQVDIIIDAKLGENLTDELAQEAMEICPVGALLVKEKGFDTPIGARKYDRSPIGTEIENNEPTKV
jgi:[NiFe] hydrogenase diaphorase moiety small subunit